MTGRPALVRRPPPRPRRGRGGRLRAGWLAGLIAVGACAEPAPPTITVRAVYVGPRFEGEAALVDHEAIPGRMDAMRMGMRVETPGALDGIAPGTAVRLTLDSLSLAILAAEPLPEGVTLDVAP